MLLLVVGGCFLSHISAVSFVPSGGHFVYSRSSVGGRLGLGSQASTGLIFEGRHLVLEGLRGLTEWRDLDLDFSR